MSEQQEKNLHDVRIAENREWVNEYNPFNSAKLFATADRWRTIQRGQPIAPPRSVSLDPLNLCNEKCIWCNAEFVMNVDKGSKLERDTLNEIPNFLYSWNDGRYGVESVCVGGGGEAWMNPYTWEMVEGLSEKGIGVGTVTNGTIVNKWGNLEALAKATWVGTSINAGTKETYILEHQKDEFDHVIENMKELISYSKRNNTKLAQPGRAPGVSWKFLLHPYNVHEVVTATKLAKEHGFKSIHVRPVSPAWFSSEEEAAPHKFTPEHIQIFREQMQEAMKYHDKDFGVYGVTHKFNPDLTPANDFESCYAIFMHMIISPPSDRNKANGKFDATYCCDRRGDDLLTGIKNGIDLNQIKEYWGSPAHWKMHDDIRVKQCPRCLPKGSEIMTKDGLKKIEDIKVDELVLTKEGIFRKVIRTFVNSSPGELIKIRIRGSSLNNPIRLTANHKLPVVTIPNCKVKSHNKRNEKCIGGCYNIPKEKRESWKEICKGLQIVDKEAGKLIQKDDFLIIPKLAQNGNVKTNPKLMKLIGYYLAEGTLSTHTKRPNYRAINFYFSDKESEYHEEIKELALELFGKKVWKTYNREGSSTIGFTLPEKDYNLFLPFGKGAHNKKLPSWIFNLNKEAKAELLKGYFNGDGSFEPWVSASSVSKQLLAQIRLLLTEFNIISSLYESNRKNGGTINGRRIKYKDKSYTLVIPNKNKEIFELLNIPIKKVILQINPGSYIDIGNYWLIQVKGLEKEEYEGDVYNIEVEDSHTYVTEGIVVNNCTFSPHNKIYQNVLQENNTSYEFI